MTMSLVYWIAAGLVCGLAETFYNRQSSAGTIAVNCVLGVAGAVASGYALSATFNVSSGWIGAATAAVIGAAMVISVARLFRRGQLLNR
jgi:uncharacterized membrane protein YeaQ/YmgE (transglycosylase-associated protein family)